MKEYMVIELFAPGGAAQVRDRIRAQGRLPPEGLAFPESWLARDGSRCFQRMETGHPLS
jgi:hypothetical protein